MPDAKEVMASDIRYTVDIINEALDSLYNLYRDANLLGIKIELENGINGEVDLKMDGVKPYRMRVVSIKQEVNL